MVQFDGSGEGFDVNAAAITEVSEGMAVIVAAVIVAVVEAVAWKWLR